MHSFSTVKANTATRRLLNFADVNYGPRQIARPSATPPHPSNKGRLRLGWHGWWGLMRVMGSPHSVLDRLKAGSYLVYSMEQSPSWDANKFSVSQKKFPAFYGSEASLQNSQGLQPVPVLSQINPAHALHPISQRSVLIFYSHLSVGLPSVLFPSGLPTKPSTQLFSLRTLSMPRPSHSSWFYQPTNICRLS